MNEPARRRVSMHVLIALFAILSLALVAGGYTHYRLEARAIRAQRYGELRTISALKIIQIVSWRHEQLSDVRLSAASLRDLAARWAVRPSDGLLQERIQQDLAMIREFHGYRNVALLGLDGQILFSLDSRMTSGGAQLKTLSERVLREGKAVLGDLWRDGRDGRVYLDALAPVPGPGGRPLALLLLRTDPEVLLFPLLQSWPMPSETAETMLVRREGEHVLFLNQPRRDRAAPLTFTRPVARQDLPASQAVMGRSGEFFGYDYGNRQVLADLQAIPGSPWFLVSKVDAQEILAEARYRGGVVLGFMGLGILMIGAWLGFLFYFGQAKLYQELFRATRFEDPTDGWKDNPRTRYAHRFVRGAGLASVLVGGLVLAGWTFDLAALKGVLPGFVMMKANTAVGFLLAGAALILQTGSRGPRRAARICAGILALLGASTFLQYLSGLDLHIDQLLFLEPEGAIGTLAPGRMAPATAINFTLFGAALILAGFRRTLTATQWLAVPVGFIGLLSLLAYLYGPLGQYGIGHYLQLALHTAGTFILLGLGLLFLDPTEGFMRRFTVESKGGWLLRRLSLVIPGLAILIGWLRTVGEKLDWFESSVGVALIVSAFVMLMLAATWWAARSLDRIDAIRSQAEARMREGAEEIRATLYGIGDGVIAADSAGCVLHMNPVAERLTGWQEGEAVGRPLEEIFRIIHEETGSGIENPLARVLREGQVVGLSSNALLVARDGTERAIADSGAPVRDDRGHITRIVLAFRDQTAERSVQRALTESEAKYRRLHESMRDAYALVAMDGRILEHNRLFREMLGYSAEELRHLTYEDLTPSEWHAMEARILEEEVLPLGYSEVYEKTYRRKDGTVFPVELRVNLLKGDQGEPIGTWALVRDITERRQWEETLRETKERLKFALDGSNDGWWDVRMDTGGVSLSPRTCEILGYPPESGERIAQEWSQLVHPDDLPATRAALEAYLEGRTPLFSVEQRLRTAAGEWKWILARGKTVAGSPEGVSLRMVGTHTDISERKKTEGILRARTELLGLTGRLAKVGGWEFDARTLKGTWTDEVARIHDLDAIQEMEVGPWIDFYSDSSRPRIQRAVQDAIEFGKPYDLELELISARGTRKIVRTAGNPVRNESGRVVLVQGIFQDITEKRAAEDLIRAAQAETQRLLEVADRSRRALLSLVEDQRIAEDEIRRLNADLELRVSTRTMELESANKELEAFAYSVSHDLRAPLRHMGGFLSMLARHLGEGLDEKGVHYLSVAQRAIERMGQLVDGLLSFSRLGRTELHVVTIDTVQLVASVLEEFRGECTDRSVRWNVGGLPALHGDATLLRLVFQNLVGNALKFTRGRPEAVIEIQPIEGLAGESGVVIRDNGVGFDPAYSHKLFGVFQRLHREDEFEGTGIGLANVHRIVSRHRGRVWAEGRLGEGASFFVVFPRTGGTE